MLDGLADWLTQVTQSFTGVSDAFSGPIAMGFALFVVVFGSSFLIRRRKAASHGHGCARCQGGYAVYGLRLAGYDGRQMGVYCPECRTFYSVETSGSRVQRIDEGFVRDRWPTSPYAKEKRSPAGAPSAHA